MDQAHSNRLHGAYLQARYVTTADVGGQGAITASRTIAGSDPSSEERITGEIAPVFRL
jgi:hypothetical protein